MKSNLVYTLKYISFKKSNNYLIKNVKNRRVKQWNLILKIKIRLIYTKLNYKYITNINVGAHSQGWLKYLL